MLADATGRIKITKTPRGEAPLEVRQAWVGLELPCLPICGFLDGQSYGVVTNTPLPNRFSFLVFQQDAVEILEKERPEASKWWKEQGYPHEGEFFSFVDDEATIISGVEIQKIEVWDDMETGRVEPIDDGR